MGLLRGDNGFYGESIFQYLEEREEGPISYILAARLYEPIQKEISQQKILLRLDDGIEISKTQYQSINGTKARRMVIVNKKRQDRPKATGS